jgi:hypothetical protein
LSDHFLCRTNNNAAFLWNWNYLVYVSSRSGYVMVIRDMVCNKKNFWKKQRPFNFVFSGRCFLPYRKHTLSKHFQFEPLYFTKRTFIQRHNSPTSR